MLGNSGESDHEPAELFRMRSPKMIFRPSSAGIEPGKRGILNPFSYFDILDRRADNLSDQKVHIGMDF
jgi:hypothetical protein